MSNIKLYYFDFTGRAELTRLVLAAGGKKYEDYRFKEGEWPTFKDQTPFGQCPVLEVDGKKFSQSVAMATYCAREGGLYGKSNLDALAIDQYVQLREDFVTLALKAYFEKDEAKKVELWKDVKEVQCPKFFGYCEKACKDNSSGFMVGSSLSLADIALFDITNGMFADKLGGLGLDAFPSLNKLMSKVGANPGIKAWREKMIESGAYQVHIRSK